MAYQLMPGEPVPAGIKRVISEELTNASAQLNGSGAPHRDEAIHEARKSIKKVRGALRLVEPHLGEVFIAENARLRNMGRALSLVRDAAAMIETFDDLKKRYRGDLGKHTLASVRRALLARKKQAERGVQIQRVAGRVAGTVEKTLKRVEKWPLQGDGFAVVQLGLKETFRRCRRAMARARKRPETANFHDWRKCVKQHWYQMRLLAGSANGKMEDYEKSLKRLENWLGEDHNLAVMWEIVAADPASFGKDTEVTFFLQLVDRYQEELRQKALEAGAAIYKEKPRAFVARMREWRLVAPPLEGNATKPV